MNDGRVITDRVWEALDLVVFKLMVLKFEGRWISPPVERSMVPASDFPTSSSKVDTAVDEVAVAKGSVWGVVFEVISDTMEWVLWCRGLVSSISCSRGRVANVDPISLSGLYCMFCGEQSRTLNPDFSGVSGILSEGLGEAGRTGNCLVRTGSYRNMSYNLRRKHVGSCCIPFWSFRLPHLRMRHPLHSRFLHQN